MARLLQLEKAEFPMNVTLSGIVKEVRFLHPLNKPSSIDVMLLEMVAVVNFLQPLKADFPMKVTLLGIVMEVRRLHPPKAPSSIVTMPLGMVMDLRSLHL